MSMNRILMSSAAVLVVIVIAVQGCGRYGRVNASTFEHAKALYAACNSRQPRRLQACAALIDEAESAQQISTTEVRYLRDIIATAQAERWEDAQAMVRQLMVDQAGR